MIDTCPKRMTYGPCGGVRSDLTCELGTGPCPFATGPLPVWPEPVQRPAVRAPRVLTDLTLLPYDLGGVAEVVGRLAPTCDALLVGEHQNRPDFPPTLLAAAVQQAGGHPVMTLTGRDRNRVVLEQELHGLRALGVETVLCATGDLRGTGVRAGVTQVFDLDGTRIAALAADVGLQVAVPESPEAEPTGARPERVLSKQRAGAQLCVLNHVSTPAAVERFVRAAREKGVTVPFVASVAVWTDERSASVLLGFPGLHLDTGRVVRVLEAPHPRAAGIAAAVEEARALLAIDGVEGVNLSGLASGDGVLAGAAVKAEIGEELQA